MHHRAELIDFSTPRYYDHTAGMLSRRLAYAAAAQSKTLHLALVGHPSALFQIASHITQGRLVFDRTDGSRAEYIFRAENLLDELMRHRLIFTGEVQIDIRLFITFESKKDFKRNVVSFFYIRRTAHRADLIRQIYAAVRFVIFRKFTVLAVRIRTDIMRLKGIYLRNAVHSRGERRAYRPT